MPVTQLLVSCPVFIPSPALLSLCFSSQDLIQGPLLTLLGALIPTDVTPRFPAPAHHFWEQEHHIQEPGWTDHWKPQRHLSSDTYKTDPASSFPQSLLFCRRRQGQGRKLDFSAAERMEKGPSYGKEYQQCCCGELPAYQPPCRMLTWALSLSYNPGRSTDTTEVGT